MGLFFSFLWPSINNVGRFKGRKGAKYVPRIIVFVMGGACFSEFRAGYEVTNDDRKNVTWSSFFFFFFWGGGQKKLEGGIWYIFRPFSVTND